MTIFRLHRHEKGFASISNKTIRDRRLSFRSRGVLSFLLSQLPTFRATSETISEEGLEGREAVRVALTELEDAGYLVREKTQDAGGLWSTVVHVYERPEDRKTDDRKPVSGATSGNTLNGLVAPTTGKPNVGGPVTKDLRREAKTEDEQRTRRATRSKKITPKKNGDPDRRIGDPVGFVAFWDRYPRKTGKGAARVAFANRLERGADPDDLIAAAAAFSEWVAAAAKVGEIESMRFVPHPATWLNQERDQDTLTVPGRTVAAGSRTSRAIAEARARRDANGRTSSAVADRNGDGGVGLADGRGDAGRLVPGSDRPT